MISTWPPPWATVGGRQYSRLTTRSLETKSPGSRDGSSSPPEDGVLATFDRPGRAIRAAGAIQESIRALGIDIRAGLHAGEIELREGGHRVGGIAVHTA